MTDFDGTTWNYTYNANNQKILETVGTSKKQYKYNGIGLLTEAITTTHSQSQTQTLTYDFAGRLKTKTFENGKQISYSYYPNGQIERITDNLGGSTYYKYNKQGQLTEIKDGNNKPLVKYEYNAQGQLEKKTHYVDGKEIAVTEYTYDSAGRLLVQSTQSGNAKRGDFAQSTQRKDAGGAEAAKVGMSAECAKSGKAEDAITYSYNDFGNLQSVTSSIGTATYGYSYDNKRITSTINGSVYDYTYHGNELFETYGVGTGRISKYIHSGMGTVGVYNATNTYNSIITDYQNSVIGILNSTSNIQNSTLANTFAYSPFGATRYASSNIQPQLTWMSRQYDKISGNHYLINRYYNSATGTFTSTDWYKYVSPNNPYSMNLYQYSYGNPMIGTDPNGLRTDFNYFQREKVKQLMEESRRRSLLFPRNSFYEVWKDGLIIANQNSINITTQYANYYIDTKIINSYALLSGFGQEISQLTKLQGVPFRFQEEMHQWLESKNFDTLKQLIMSPAEEFAEINLADSEKDLMDNVWVITPATAGKYSKFEAIRLKNEIQKHPSQYKLNSNVTDAILYNNGVNNKLENALETAVMIANKSQKNVILFHNPTAGFLDMPQCLVDKIHTELVITKKLKSVIELYMTDFGKSSKIRHLTLFSHSEGTMHSTIMLRYLEQKYKDELSVRYFGSPEYTNPIEYGVKDFKNYVNPYDVVTHLGGMMNMNPDNFYLPLNHFGFGRNRALNLGVLIDNHSMTESYLPMYFSLSPVFR